MFNNTNEAPTQELNKSSNIIGKETQLEGSLSTSGNLRIEGKIKGSIKTSAKVVLGGTSVVEGDVIADTAEIGGEIHGTVKVSSLLTLKSTALVHGDIATSKLVLEAGARFNGKCDMSGNNHPQSGETVAGKKSLITESQKLDTASKK